MPLQKRQKPVMNAQRLMLTLLLYLYGALQNALRSS